MNTMFITFFKWKYSFTLIFQRQLYHSHKLENIWYNFKLEKNCQTWKKLEKTRKKVRIIHMNTMFITFFKWKYSFTLIFQRQLYHSHKLENIWYNFKLEKNCQTWKKLPITWKKLEKTWKKLEKTWKKLEKNTFFSPKVW